MRLFFAILVTFFSSQFLFGQFVQLNTGTNSHLMDLSVFNNNVAICGTFSYLVKSTDACSSFTQVVRPGPNSNANQLQRLDVNNLNLLSYSPGQILVYQSSDGGDNWNQIFDTTGMYSCHMNFLDKNRGFVTFGSDLLQTKNGGASWSAKSFSNNTFGLDIVECYGDSLVCLGGGGFVGGIFVTKNAGRTWLNAGTVGGGRVVDFFFLNEDTIFCTGNGLPSGFSLSTNGGQSWIQRDIPLDIAFGINFRSKNEGYVVGATSQTMGIILKTEDMGQTWSTLNTGIKTCFFKMEFLDDSIALISGSDGVLVKWKYKNAVFTGIPDHLLNSSEIKVFPSPVADKLHFDYQSLNSNLVIEIRNNLSEILYHNNFDLYLTSIDVSFLPPGVYLLTLSSETQRRTRKFVKE